MRRLRGGLLASVSAAALTLFVGVSAAVAGADAPAAVPAVRITAPHDLFTVTLEGGLLWQGDAGQSFSPLFFQTIPELPVLAPSGYSGAISVNWQPALSPWSFGISLRMGAADRGAPFSTTATLLYIATTPLAGTRSRSTTHTMVDFEVGRDLGLGGAPGDASAKVTAGLRFARLTDEYTLNGVIATSTTTAAIGLRAQRAFQGIGPRIGFAFAKPLAENWSLFGSANAALLFGTSERSGTLTLTPSSGPPSFTASMSTQQMVPNFDASAGIAYAVRPDASIAVGYRAETFLNAYVNDPIAIFGIPLPQPTRFDENVWSHGPFAQFKLRF